MSVCGIVAPKRTRDGPNDTTGVMGTEEYPWHYTRVSWGLKYTHGTTGGVMGPSLYK